MNTDKMNTDKHMTTYKSKAISSAPEKFGSVAFCWRTGQLLVLLSALLLPGCSKKTDPAVLEEMKALDSSSAADREDALLHLADMGDKAKPAAPKAVELLNDQSEGVRNAAIQLIIRTEHNTPESLAGIGALASEDEDEEVRHNALNALKSLGAHEKHAKIYAELLNSGKERQRELGALGLSEAGEHAAVAQAQLVAGLKDKLPYVRMYCAMALGNLGAKASDEAKAQLETMKNDREKMVADTVKEALKKLQ